MSIEIADLLPRRVASMIAEITVKDICGRPLKIIFTEDRYEWCCLSILCQLVSMPITVSRQHASS
jgi:hypothetical protein